MPSVGSIYIIIGLIIGLAPICLDKRFDFEPYLGVYGALIEMLGMIIGAFLIMKGHKKLGLKNKTLWRK